MQLDPNRTVNVSVQILPLVDDLFPLIDRAIRVIQASGVKHEVDPMETVMEGPLDQLLEVAKAAHLACMNAGAETLVTLIKIGDRAGGTSMESKVAKYRRR
ncbi:MAG: thiamine-binding protein [Anaerolineales bacterium]|nr:thiamine-binding protein [Anaerolineales bacterium]